MKTKTWCIVLPICLGVVAIGVTLFLIFGKFNNTKTQTTTQDKVRAQVEVIVHPTIDKDEIASGDDVLSAAIRRHVTYEIKKMDEHKKTFKLEISAPDMGKLVDSMIDPQKVVLDDSAESQEIEDTFLTALKNGKTQQIKTMIDVRYTLQNGIIALSFDEKKMADALSGRLLSKYEELLTKYGKEH